MLVDEIAASIAATTIGSLPASTLTSTQWVVTKAHIPDTPDRVIAVLPTGGENPLVDTMRRPSFEVFVRGPAAGASTALGRCELVKAHLDQKARGTLSGTTYEAIRMQGDILMLGYDEQNRPEFSANFNTIRIST